jgi:hypothetical protein
MNDNGIYFQHPKKEIKLIIKPISFLKNRPLPSKVDIISVYSIIAFMIYSWTMITFFYTLPSWIKYLTVKEIVIIFAYAMIVDLFESIMVLAGFLFLYFLLPKSLLKEDFAIHGTWLAISCLGVLMLYFVPSLDLEHQIKNPWLWLVITFFLAILSTIFFSRLSFMKKFAHFFLDRMPAFLVIFAPVSVISLLIITIYLLF